MQEVEVSNYTISIVGNVAELSFDSLINYSQIFVLADENTLAFCYPQLQEKLPAHTLITIQSGEKNKSIDTCKSIWSGFADAQADRNAVCINLGGGVIGDMGGFVASTFKRGFDFIQMPTTLLSQVDASVGGKLGVDFNGLKNIIGVFNHPKSVWIATDFLQTLPPRQMINGYAEVVKHGLIADAGYWKEIRKVHPLAMQNPAGIVQRSVEIKKKVVEADFKETGERKILNFGHTIGHAIETWSLLNDSDPLLHGEAIAIGIICEGFLSHISCTLHAGELESICDYIFDVFPRYDLGKIPFNELLAIMQQDKKNSGGNLQFSLLQSIGKCSYNVQVSERDIYDAFTSYTKL